MKKKFVAGLIIGLLMFGVVGMANATLIGDTVSCSTSGSSWSCAPSTAVVDASSIEFGVMLHADRAFDLDINSDSINFDVLRSIGNIYGLAPVSIFDIDSIITGFTFATDIPGMDASRLSFTPSSFNVNFDTLYTTSGQYLDIYLQTAGGSVPEPTTMLLLTLGLMGLAGVRRKIQK